MNNKIKVAAYCRVSTDYEDQLNSLSTQIKYFTEYISNHDGWELIEVYYDEGITGTSVKKRDGFNRMIKDCENGKINLILTKEVSRFARNTVDTLCFTRKLSSLGIGVIFMNDGIDTRDKDGELRLTIMASIAQEESRKVSERVKWGIKRRMENGVILGCGRICGYKVENKQMVIIPDEAEIVQKIFHTYLYDGKGANTIARELNNQGLRTVNGKMWCSQAILRILRNEKYVGDLTQCKVYCTDYLTKKMVRNHGENPDKPLITVSEHHDGIIPRELWDEVQAELERRGRLTKEGMKHSKTHWHSGKIFCGKCGKPYHINGNHTYRNRLLRCSNRARYGKTVQIDKHGNTVGCDNESVNENVLDCCIKHVLEKVKYCRKDIELRLIEEIKLVQKFSKKADTKKLKNEIEHLKEKKRNAIDLMLEGLISKDDLKQQTEFYECEITRLTEEIARNKNIEHTHKEQLERIQEYIDMVNQTENLDTDSTEIYKNMLDRINVYEGNVLEVYLTCIPFGFRVNYRVERCSRIGKFDVYVDDCCIAA